MLLTFSARVTKPQLLAASLLASLMRASRAEKVESKRVLWTPRPSRATACIHQCFSSGLTNRPLRRRWELYIGHLVSVSGDAQG